MTPPLVDQDNLDVCPFCDAKRLYVKYRDNLGGNHDIICRNCGASGPTIKARWNDRPKVEQIQAKLDYVKEKVYKLISNHKEQIKLREELINTYEDKLKKLVLKIKERK